MVSPACTAWLQCSARAGLGGSCLQKDVLNLVSEALNLLEMAQYWQLSCWPDLLLHLLPCP